MTKGNTMKKLLIILCLSLSVPAYAADAGAPQESAMVEYQAEAPKASVVDPAENSATGTGEEVMASVGSVLSSIKDKAGWPATAAAIIFLLMSLLKTSVAGNLLHKMPKKYRWLLSCALGLAAACLEQYITSATWSAVATTAGSGVIAIFSHHSGKALYRGLLGMDKPEALKAPKV